MTVSLVGAGPGDPELITVRGLALVRGCDILVYDRLVSPALVAEAPAEALRIPRDPLSQAEVNDLLVRYGRAGLETVRLKGGDPFVFGRGGEEALALAAAGVPFAVVPGVSSLASVPGAAGIPVTHRGVASRVTALAAHDPAALDYGQLATTPGTLVLFMGLGALAPVVGGLLAAGKDPSTPAAVVAEGTLPAQQVVSARLASLPAAAAGARSPALVVIGDVVELAGALAAPAARRRIPAAA